MKTNAKKARNVMIFSMGIVCALAGPLAGWMLNGGKLDYFDHFLRMYPEKAIVYGVIGFVAGIGLALLLELGLALMPS